MKKTVITVSREYGSGGRLIAKKLADELGIGYYDGERLYGGICPPQRPEKDPEPAVSPVHRKSDTSRVGYDIHSTVEGHQRPL